MATIAATAIASGAVLATQTTMTASDTFTYNQAKSQTLIIRNGTAGALTIVIDGADGTTVSVDGMGDPISVAGGFSFGVAVSAVRVIRLSSIRKFLQGVITVTGGTGATAILLEG